MKHTTILNILTLISLISFANIQCVGGWNNQGYQPIKGYEPIQGDGESTPSFKLKMNVAYDITHPNEINFLVAVRDGNMSTINDYLKTKSFMNNASPFLFKAAADIAAKRGDKNLSNKFLKLSKQ